MSTRAAQAIWALNGLTLLRLIPDAEQGDLTSIRQALVRQSGTCDTWQEAYVHATGVTPVRPGVLTVMVDRRCDTCHGFRLDPLGGPCHACMGRSRRRENIRMRCLHPDAVVPA